MLVAIGRSLVLGSIAHGGRLEIRVVGRKVLVCFIHKWVLLFLSFQILFSFHSQQQHRRSRSRVPEKCTRNSDIERPPFVLPVGGVLSFGLYQIYHWLMSTYWRLMTHISGELARNSLLQSFLENEMVIIPILSGLIIIGSSYARALVWKTILAHTVFQVMEVRGIGFEAEAMYLYVPILEVRSVLLCSTD